MNKKVLVVIAGPTAVGKTDIGISLAKLYNTDIISSDSRQIFKEMKIGVARPNANQLASVKHHFIASRSIEDEYNAGLYEEDSNACLQELFQSKNVVVMVGGTGLYIKSSIEGLDHLPKANPALREELKMQLNKEGIESLQQRLDNPEFKDQNNPQRLIRAIEIKESEFAPDAKNVVRNYHCIKIYLQMDRDALYSRINQRVDLMMKGGLLDEAEALYPKRSLNALQTVGYKELFDYLDGNSTLEQAVEKIKQHSRNYAKRQITWFKNQGFTGVEAKEDRVVKYIAEALKNLN
ncbi:MAG: tRNA (adenosine(37)-N6)-dimethylallyltransferase MiaA [Bacteroidia bacterium]